MRKRLALFTAAVGIIVAGVVAFMAFESYTLDINAHLEPVLSVNPHGDWELGTVYPETGRTTKLFVGLSNSAKADPNFIAVQYTLTCQPKPLVNSTGFAVSSGNGPGTIVPGRIVLNLCPNITVTDQVTGGGLCTINNPCIIPPRTLTAASQQDGYSIAIVFPDCIGAHQKEPLVKEIDCGFDPATQKFAGVDLGARISIQVLDIAQEEKCITKKDGTPLATCVKGPQNVDQIVDLDGIASPLAGGADDQEVAKGDPLVSWVKDGPTGGLVGIDVFDNDFDGAWTKGIDDLHLEAASAACPTGIRDALHQIPEDCQVLDLDGSLFDGQEVTCDLEANIAFITPCPPLLAFHDANGNGAYDNGEDIVLDNNNDGIFD